MPEHPEPEPSSDGGVPAHRYTAALAGQIEVAWQDRWEREGTFHAANPTGPAVRRASTGWPTARSCTCSTCSRTRRGPGLHVGHPLGYIGTDVFARYHRMAGRNVLHTLGYDAFGLPAEQYAVQTGTHPRITTEANIAIIAKQLRRIGLAHDPRRAVSTIDPGFYRWTQWIFLQIFGSWYDRRPGPGPAHRRAGGRARRRRPASRLRARTRPARRGPTSIRVARRKVVDAHRLAYLEEVPVNWCPGLGTVLANEEVTADGRSERGNFPVFRRPMKQWVMRITAYADRLLDDLDRLDWPESIKLMQRNWIGRSEGAEVRFSTEVGPITVFTTRPDTLFGATYMVLAPEHPMVDDLLADAWPEGTDPRWTGGAAIAEGSRRGLPHRRRPARASSTARPPSATRPACSSAPSPPTR